MKSLAVKNGNPELNICHIPRILSENQIGRRPKHAEDERHYPRYIVRPIPVRSVKDSGRIIQCKFFKVVCHHAISLKEVPALNMHMGNLESTHRYQCNDGCLCSSPCACMFKAGTYFKEMA